ncbi:TPA: hypothetical protein HA338_12665 [Methanosarcina acetivorans]|uniref:Uncharacterized protein n=1 Tax=Methanosarcina acetivorans TaxID=2214 RepID=A0A832S969_9EURY|nr:hypothetical protein [Methanosarcina acetivorans]HIH94826.1 hypothetical protein [Methanosarcina acetivorans]
MENALINSKESAKKKNNKSSFQALKLTKEKKKIDKKNKKPSKSQKNGEKPKILFT